jgi:antirestriction protein ArdC
MATQTEIRNSITQKIFDAVKSGDTLPWRKTWSSIPDPVRFPTNISSGNAYRGINCLICQHEANEKNYPVGYWATYKQFQALGQQVRRGERSTQIVYYKQIKKTRTNDQGKEETTTFPLLRTWNVFNISQTDGELADKFLTPSTSAPVEDDDHDEFFDVIEATKADIRYGGNRAAYYRSPLDFIQMPHREQFEDFSAFADTLSHEVVHWSGAKHRLDRELTYAQEELVAEIGAAFLLQSTGVPHPHLDNTTSYIVSWLKVSEGQDARFIFKAASLASTAVDFIMGFSKANEEATELVTEVSSMAW